MGDAMLEMQREIARREAEGDPVFTAYAGRDYHTPNGIPKR
jgi:hypothetical protein